jgi:hypothetical protein
VLKIEASGLQVLPAGSVTALQPRADLFLIGHPAERGFWRISASAFLQTDSRSGHMEVWASDMNFAGGNSGGPIVNRNGQAIGLFHGAPPLDLGPIRVSPPQVVWGWRAFEALFGWDDEKLKIAAAVAIDVAMARAQQIIQTQANLP